MPPPPRGSESYFKNSGVAFPSPWGEGVKRQFPLPCVRYRDRLCQDNCAFALCLRIAHLASDRVILSPAVCVCMRARVRICVRPCVCVCVSYPNPHPTFLPSQQPDLNAGPASSQLSVNLGPRLKFPVWVSSSLGERMYLLSHLLHIKPQTCPRHLMNDASIHCNLF